MKIGDKITWAAVNSLCKGVIAEAWASGNWLVLVGDNRYVIVNEKSVIQG